MGVVRAPTGRFGRGLSPLGLRGGLGGGDATQALRSGSSPLAPVCVGEGPNEPCRLPPGPGVSDSSGGREQPMTGAGATGSGGTVILAPRLHFCSSCPVPVP